MPVRSLNSSVVKWPDRQSVQQALLERRSIEWDATDLPVPADVLVYTDPEWQALEAEGRRLAKETRWIDLRALLV